MKGLLVPAELDPGFSPLALAWRAYQRDVAAHGSSVRFVVAIQRNDGFSSPWEAQIFPEGVEMERTIQLLERIAKGLLWMRGGYKIKLSGCRALYEHMLTLYKPSGARAFDAKFMGGVYERPFEVTCHEDPSDISVAREATNDVGRHLDGCRIGFDAGGSDRKVSAVIDGVSVFSQETIWFPKTAQDPDYHIQGILSSIQAAAEHLPRVDAIGVSSAGIYIDNRTREASLFLKVPQAAFEKKVKNIYVDIAAAMGNVPLVVANDGDVTALAGAMSLEEGRVLGIAMGTSQAGGYVNEQMHLMGWLNELAFVPIDLNPLAMADEWSGDIGCGVKYFSQDGVIKLAPAAGIHLADSLSPAEKLQAVQDELARGHAGARGIFDTIGVYLGHAVAYYALFYDIRHVLLMGRVTSGEGGTLIHAAAQRVLKAEYPDLAERISLSMPDEKNRRVGQSIAAASLPKLRE